MTVLFFSCSNTIDSVSELVFKSLGIVQGAEGDSANSLGGSYYSATILGLTIRLELNSYDYEEQYNYMLSIKKSKGYLNIDARTIDLIVEAIKRLLSINLSVIVAEEKEGALEVYNL